MKISYFIRNYLAGLAIVASAFSPNLSAEEVSTDPVGYVTLNVTSGLGSTKRLTYLSLPLLEKASGVSGQTVGTITGVTSNTISNSNAGWTSGELSNPSSPFVIQITSGTAVGRIFLIASSATTGGAIGGTGLGNTATTINISSFDIGSGVDLVAAGVQAGDTYAIYTCETLSSVFGTPASSGVQGGTSSSNADTVVLLFNGSANTYFYSTTNSRWSRVFSGSPDASNVPILPYYGLIYQRLPASALAFTVTGSVPTIARKTQVKNSGVTLLSQFWPSDSTLAELNLQSLPGWVSNSSSASADKVILVSGGSAFTYWHDGTNWKRIFSGSPISNTVPVPAGATVYINKLGTTTGFSTFSQNVPYSL